MSTRLEGREIAGSEVHWIQVYTGSEFLKDDRAESHLENSMQIKKNEVTIGEVMDKVVLDIK